MRRGRKLFDEYCRLDVRVQFEVIPATEHVTGAGAAAPETIAWLADRFAGRPAPSSCG